MLDGSDFFFVFVNKEVGMKAAHSLLQLCPGSRQPLAERRYSLMLILKTSSLTGLGLNTYMLEFTGVLDAGVNLLLKNEKTSSPLMTVEAGLCS